MSEDFDDFLEDESEEINDGIKDAVGNAASKGAAAGKGLINKGLSKVPWKIKLMIIGFIFLFLVLFVVIFAVFFVAEDITDRSNEIMVAEGISNEDRDAIYADAGLMKDFVKKHKKDFEDVLENIIDYKTFIKILTKVDDYNKEMAETLTVNYEIETVTGEGAARLQYDSLTGIIDKRSVARGYRDLEEGESEESMTDEEFIFGDLVEPDPKDLPSYEMGIELDEKIENIRMRAERDALEKTFNVSNDENVKNAQRTLDGLKTDKDNLERKKGELKKEEDEAAKSAYNSCDCLTRIANLKDYLDGGHRSDDIINVWESNLKIAEEKHKEEEANEAKIRASFDYKEINNAIKQTEEEIASAEDDLKSAEDEATKKAREEWIENRIDTLIANDSGLAELQSEYLKQLEIEAAEKEWRRRERIIRDPDYNVETRSIDLRISDVDNGLIGDFDLFYIEWQPILALAALYINNNEEYWGTYDEDDDAELGKSYYLSDKELDDIINIFVCDYVSFYDYNKQKNKNVSLNEALESPRGYKLHTEFANLGRSAEIPDESIYKLSVSRVPQSAPKCIFNSFISYTYTYSQVLSDNGTYEFAKITERTALLEPSKFFEECLDIYEDFEITDFLEVMELLPGGDKLVDKYQNLYAMALKEDGENRIVEVSNIIDSCACMNVIYSDKVENLDFSTPIRYDGGIYMWPLPSKSLKGYVRISSDFGYRIDPVTGKASAYHKGIDIAAYKDTPIYAAYDGVVKYAGYNQSMGNYVKIDHDDGVRTVYMHANSLNCKAGDVVKMGDVIAYVGTTGRSTGNHLHFQVEKDGTPVSPWIYVSEP